MRKTRWLFSVAAVILAVGTWSTPTVGARDADRCRWTTSCGVGSPCNEVHCAQCESWCGNCEECSITDPNTCNQPQCIPMSE